ncbi:transcriptional regulator [Flavobacterium okayamense]|uniref:Transcriptional regulator n=1 Tax=Flavobacterium okayamense TaxID=2830782 RepID=A0ABM7S2M2_9FLAO|nr:transcriptional regulator [Flavobacterium okayamense]
MFIASDYVDILSENIVSTFAVLFFVWLTLLPPLLYGIIQFKLNKVLLDIRHLYIPIVLFFINIFSLLYFSVQKDEKVFTYEVVENVMTYSNYIIILFVFPISTFYYSFLSFRSLQFFPSKNNFKKNIEKGLLFWFVLLYDVYIFIWILTNYLIDNSSVKSVLKVYYTGYFILSIAILFKLSAKRDEFEIEDSENSIFEEIGKKLNHKIHSDKIFLNPQINLKLLAKEIGTNEKYLSQYINKNYNKNFSLFINEFRVEYAKQILINGEYSNYTLEAIGSLSGFNSKTSFNSTFKKYTGETPSEFKNKKELN